jgi:hypothetical protein
MARQLQPRRSSTYRAARRAEARRQGLLWRELPVLAVDQSRSPKPKRPYELSAYVPVPKKEEE